MRVSRCLQTFHFTSREVAFSQVTSLCPKSRLSPRRTFCVMSSQQAPEKAKVLSTKPLDSKDAKWMRMVEITYQDPAGKERKWESAERTTRGEKGAIDAVGIVTILQKPTGPELLLQKQFRAPTGKVSIEIPAGLIDPGEDGDQAALRELNEETGYVGEVSKSSGDELAEGVMFNDPGFTNTNTIIRHVKVDLDKEENRKPKPKLEEGEFIETFSVRLDDLYMTIRQLEKEGYAIDARVGTLAEGYELRKKFGG